MMIVLWICLLVGALILQATVTPLIAVNGIKPDFLLIIVVSTGLLTGKERGVGLGFFSGLLQDLVSGSSFGVNILAKMVTGFVCGMAERKVFKEYIFLPAIALFFATFFNGIIMLLLLFLLGYKIDLLPAILYNILPQVGYNVLFSIPVHKLVYKLIHANRDNQY
ncbi:MAG: rod shape-determining protein MreD [Pelosinus sp.]|nr:rod shape-determining protein MreD [Pelosinus sp.]